VANTRTNAPWPIARDSSHDIDGRTRSALIAIRIATPRKSWCQLQV